MMSSITYDSSAAILTIETSLKGTAIKDIDTDGTPGTSAQREASKLAVIYRSSGNPVGCTCEKRMDFATGGTLNEGIFTFHHQRFCALYPPSGYARP